MVEEVFDVLLHDTGLVHVDLRNVVLDQIDVGAAEEVEVVAAELVSESE